MPTYEYICTKCGGQFELVQSIADSALTVCPKEHCTQKKWGKGKVKRLISAGGGLLFKGSGFYTTDYRSDSYKQGAKSDSSSSTTSSSSGSKTAAKGGETKSGGESKPAVSSTPPSSGGSSSTGKTA